MAFALEDDKADMATWIGFAMMCVGVFMALLDTQVVVTSLPTIQRALTIPQDEMSWLQTAYLIAEIISIPLTGLLIRTLGVRWLFVGAVSVFTLASVGCASSAGFGSLIVWRVFQGLSGGTLIPAVFAAVFLLFPLRLQTAATTIASVVAVSAPTVGPVVGGWITQTYTWPWLFLVNVSPGIMAALIGGFFLPRVPLQLDQLKGFDVAALAFAAGGLAALEIAIKQAPAHGWMSPSVVGLLAVCLVAAVLSVRRVMRAANPLVDMRLFRRSNFAIGCLLSFVIGMGLYGSIYLMPVFLAYVRDHNALEIGEIMLVTGIAQLACAPIAAALVRPFDTRLLSAIGFLLLGLGAALSADQSRATDFAGMFAGQVVRGCAFMLCILAPTELALGNLPEAMIPDASGLFNMMRNLGGAVGIAVIDSILYTRGPQYGEALYNGLIAGNEQTFAALGLTQGALMEAAADPRKQAAVATLLKKTAFVDAVNDAWLALSMTAIVVVVVLLFAEPSKLSADS